MPGPGGDEVARVSVRVVPNTDGFRSELARELSAIESSMKVSIPVEADTAGFRAEVKAAVASAAGQDAEIDIGADTAGAKAETAAFAAQVEGMNPDIDVDADTGAALTEAAAARTAIDAMKATIKVEVDIDKDKLAGATAGAGGKDKGGGLDALTNGFKALLSAGKELPGVLGAVGGAIGSVAGTALSAGQGMFSMATGALGMGKAMGGAAAGAAGLAVAIVMALAKMVAFGAQASVVLAVMGAVTAVVGMAGAAISSLPALLLGAAAAGVAVALGMDGIKKAAQAAVPGLNQLKAAVSGVFEAKLTPMFRDLGQRVFPQLTAGLKAVADSVSNLIIELVGVATSAAGIANLNALFGNTQVLLSTITPSLKGLVQVFLQIGATTGVFRELGLLISTVVSRVTELFAKFAEGGDSSLMVRSLQQLRLVLDAALGALNAFILGATVFFTAAGPGLRDMFLSIQATIEKINFQSLGESFGIFARAVGTFFESIPQSTWDALVASIRDLALKCQELANDSNMQAFFAGLIMIIPTAINMFTDVLGAVRAFVNFATTSMAIAKQAFTDAFNSIKVVVLVAALSIIDCLGLIASGINALLQNLPGVPQGFRDASQGAVDALTGMRAGVAGELDQTIGEIERSANGATQGGKALGEGAAQGAEQGIDPMDQRLAAEAKAASEQVRGQAGPANSAGNAVGTGALDGARTGIAPMPGDMRNTSQQAAEGVRGTSGLWSQIGTFIIQALANAISGGAASVIAAAINVARAAINAAKNALGIASPSRVFRDEVGVYIPAGMAVGMEKATPLAVKAATAMAGAVAAAAQRAIGTDPNLRAAARELLNRIRSGGQVFEDFSFRGMSENLGKFNDELREMFNQFSRGDYNNIDKLEQFLGKLADSSVASQAGKGLGSQIGQGIDDGLAQYDRVVSAARGAYMNAVWRNNGGNDTVVGHPKTDVVEALQNGIVWRIELDPEGVAQLSAQGARSLERR